MLADSWRVAGLSVTGASHRRRGLDCEDACGWFTAGEFIAIGVADGAGTAPLAAVGSSVAVRSALFSIVARHMSDSAYGRRLRHMRPGPWKRWHKWLRRWIRRDGMDPDIPPCSTGALCLAMHAAVDAIEREAACRRVPPTDMACTLILVVANPELVAVLHVGDGAVILADDTEIVCLSNPTSGEHANETPLLCYPESATVTQWRGRPRHLAVISDGLQPVALQMATGRAHEPFFRPLFDWMASQSYDVASQAGIGAFLHWPRLATRVHDDVTVVAAHLP